MENYINEILQEIETTEAAEVIDILQEIEKTGFLRGSKI